MLFPTVQFAIFFPIVLALSWALMSRPQVWKPFIIAASYVFYAAASWRFCLLLAGVTIGNQAAARLIDRTGDQRRRSVILGVAVALDLGVLAVFKYYGFFVQSLAHGLDTVRLGLPLPLLAIALPVGVSFFTFQAISYVVDVKRGVVRPASLVDIADYLARTVVDPVFAVPQAFAGPDAWLAAYGYTAQIYCDFSGYTDIAIGLALLMGFVFPQNFNSPYRATSFGDFWRRWHMTLSRFLRDFLYIPLGGNRGGRWRTARN